MYGVVSTGYAGGPGPRQLFDLPLVALNTALLLVQEGAALRARPLRDQVRELIEFDADEGRAEEASHRLFDLPLVALNTALLLVSSITFGQAIPHMEAGRVGDGDVRTVRADQGEESRQEGAALRARPLRDQVRELPVDVLALPRHHLDRRLYLRLPSWSDSVSLHSTPSRAHRACRPG
jgi:hypothetical protein